MKVLEQIQIQPIFPAVVVADADDDTMQTGDYVSFKDFNSLLILIAFGDGTATSGDITATLSQATDNGGTGDKVLNALETGRIYDKVNATTLAAVSQWTAKTQATADEVYTDATSGEKLGFIALEVRASDLDATNGFDHVKCDLSAITSAKLVCGLYILAEPKLGTQPDLMPSVI